MLRCRCVQVLRRNSWSRMTFLIRPLRSSLRSAQSQLRSREKALAAPKENEVVGSTGCQSLKRKWPWAIHPSSAARPEDT